MRISRRYEGSMNWKARESQRKAGAGKPEAVSYKDWRGWSDRKMLESGTMESLMSLVTAVQGLRQEVG